MIARSNVRPLIVAIIAALVPGGLGTRIAFADASEADNAKKDLVGPVLVSADEKAGEPKKEEPKKEEPKKEDPYAKLLKGFYGVLDSSFDVSTKGIEGKIATQYGIAGAIPVIAPLTNPPTLPASALATSVHAPPVGKVGWIAALSTNKSKIGYKGEHKIGSSETKFVFQLEAAFAITATPGLYTSYTQQSNTVRSWGYGDNYIGIKGPWGALKFGTTYGPYKNSTNNFNPFSGMLGDYAVVMGNSGGDNRVEGETRLDHSIFYESPKIGGVLNIDLLFSPGQNRTFDNIVQSLGSPDCNGGNIPGSGNLPLNCDDGGFGDAASGSIRFESHGFYLSGAYEWHHNVNRNSDGIGANNYQYAIFAAANPNLVVTPSNNPQGLPASGLGGYINDIGDEWFANVAALYKSPVKFTFGGIYEWMRRDIPSYLAFQNERSRDGSWVFANQDIGNTSISVGWAHAGKTPGDPGGQHNYNPLAPADTANMYTVALKQKLDKQLYWYINYANTVNHGNVHYDLGAGGRGLTTDCHDGTSTAFVDYSGTGPTTWGGCHPVGVSTGLHFTF